MRGSPSIHLTVCKVPFAAHLLSVGRHHCPNHTMPWEEGFSSWALGEEVDLGCGDRSLGDELVGREKKAWGTFKFPV
jgi:hypothetical protein